jgi:hypothetical protein
MIIKTANRLIRTFIRPPENILTANAGLIKHKIGFSSFIDKTDYFQKTGSAGKCFYRQFNKIQLAVSWELL